MAVDMDHGVRASRMRVPRSRGAFSGIALVVLGAWAALVPFIGPYFSFAFLPAPTDAWHWTAGRGWLEVAPGAAAVVAGILLLVGTHRVNLTFASWLGAASGAWLVVGPVLAPRMSLSAGAPASLTPWVATLEELFFYYAIGAAIIFFASTALGRLTVQSVRDVRAAQRRAEAEAAREQAAREQVARERAARDEEERRLAEQRASGGEGEGGDEAYRREQQAAQLRAHQGGDERAQQWEQQRAEAAAAGRGEYGSTSTAGGAPAEPPAGSPADYPGEPQARHERPADQPPNFAPPTNTGEYPPAQPTDTREFPAQRT